MDPEIYEEWIKAYVARFDSPKHTLGRCREAVEEMHREFPLLRVVKGHVYCPPPWGKRAHWWLEDQDHGIIDPTRSQFPGILFYQEYIEGDDVRIGKCMECGTELWGPPEQVGKMFCGTECEQNYIACVEGSIGL
jgi:hypothetical protein